MLKKLLTHSFLYSLAPQVPKLAAIALMPIITRELTSTDYGIYGVITSYLFFMAALKDLGFATVFVNTFYKYPYRWRFIWKLLHGHLVIWSVIYAVLSLILLYIFLPTEARSNFLVIAFLAITPAVLFDNTNMVGNFYFRFRQKPVYIAIIAVVTGITSILITYYCVVELKLGYLSWFISSFASTLVMFFFYAYPIYFKQHLWPIIRFRKKFILPHLKVALPMIPHSYSSYLLNASDRIVMDLYKINVNKIGLYNIAYQFGNYFEVAGEAVGMAVGPYYSKLFTSKAANALDDARRLTFFLMSGFLMATFMTSLWLKEIFSILIKNTQLSSTYGLGILILMGYAYRPMYWSAGIRLSVNEKTVLLWRISFIGGLLNVLLNVIFVPIYGIYAAAVNTFISLLYIGFAGFFMKQIRQMRGPAYFPMVWMLAIIVLTIVAYCLKDLVIEGKLMISIVIVFLAGFFFRKYYRLLNSIDV